VSVPGESGLPPDLSLHGLTVSPGGPVRRDEALPAPSGGFTFLRELGRGGMGVVYEAVEDATGRHVALKIISQRSGLGADAAERFEREARLAGSISHENCVFVYGAHVIHGAPAISMEMMPGHTLEDRIRAPEPVPIEAAVGWTIDILDGLDAAHALGIVHRDVKPSNCFLTANGRVKVGDFGLSRSLEGDLGLTQSGAFLGSPLYASPEQVRGRKVDQRADVYSAGATLYALLAGRPPHSGSSVGDVLAQIVSEAPLPVSSLRPGIPRSLDAIVARALAKDPARRFQDCAAFRNALRPYGPNGLTPATLGLRVAAYVVDSILVSLLFQGGSYALYLLGFRYPSALPDAAWLPAGRLARVLPDVLLIAWFAVLESRFGGSVGKRLLGLRVVSMDGGQPGLLRSALRAAIFMGPFLVASSLADVVSREVEGGLRIVAFLVPLLAMRKRNGYRGFHELATGTRVVRSQLLARDRGRSQAFDPGRPSAAGLPAAIGPYPVGSLVGTTDRGTVVTATDPALERSVWIHFGDAVGGRGGDGTHEALRPLGLRWIRRGSDPVPYDVFESPGGGPPAEYVASRGTVAWPVVLEQLRGLIDELAARGGDVVPEQLWIDRWGRLRVLDFAIGGRTPSTPVAVLGTAARVLLVGAPGPGAGVLPADLPLHADATVRRLFGLAAPFATLEEARAALADLASRPAILSRRRRAAQVVLTAIWLANVALGALIMFDPDGPAAPGPGAGAGSPAPSTSAAIIVAAAYCVPSIVLGFALRGGLTFTLLGVRLRDSAGRAAARWRCAWRSFVACSPTFPALVTWSVHGVPPQWHGLAAAASAILLVAGGAWSVMRPEKGIADWIAGTRPVRR
jgi:uncharacterized RDD family membrane protein YckC